MELVNVRQSFRSYSAHYRFRLHLLLQLCSTLHVPVAQIQLKCAQCDERRAVRRSRCTAYSRAIINPIYSLNTVADLVLICLVRGWVDLSAPASKVM
jgi:hypothetical protein